MRVRLEAIKFNHDPHSATGDAFNLRRNEAEAVEVPEWRRGSSINPEDSPAAYALRETYGQKLTIQANFSCAGGGGRPLEVRAIDARLDPRSPASPTLEEFAIWLLRPALYYSVGNVLGEVGARQLPSLEGETGFQPFELKHVRIWSAGVGTHDITWRWQCRLVGDAEWEDFATTRHRIYTVVGVPRPPWLQDVDEASGTQLPWTAVLDHACDWAAGALNTDDAAERITRKVYDLGRGVVNYCSSAYYTDVNNFNCTSFLNLLRGGDGAGKFVNCDDCATIVSTFANAVGCDLRQLTLKKRRGGIFKLKPVIKIGEVSPEPNPAFFHHAVASEGGCDEEREVFDSCLQLDGDDNPGMFTALLPTNLRFGRVGEQGYRFRLLLNREQEAAVLPDTEHCRLRRIGGTPRPRPHSPELLSFTKEFYDFDSWESSLSECRSPFFYSFFFADYFLPNLTLVQMIESEADAQEPSSQSLWAAEGEERPFLRIDAYERASAADAVEGVMALLTTFQQPGMNRQESADLGDVAFAVPRFTTVLFATGNLIFFLRNTTRAAVSLEEVARSLNDNLRRPPPGAHVEQLGEAAVRRFSFSTNRAPVNTDIPIDEKPAELLARRRLYQFITDAGKVSLKDGGLVYRPEKSGENVLEIFGADARGDFARQVLRLEAE